MKMLHAIKMFGANLDEYLHLLLPPVVKLFDSVDIPVNVRKWVAFLYCLSRKCLDVMDE